MAFYQDMATQFNAIRTRLQQVETARLQAQQATEDQVNQASLIQRLYKWMPPGASLAFSQAGFDPDTVHRLASNALAAFASNTALGLNQPGDLVRSDVQGNKPNVRAAMEAQITAQQTGQDPYRNFLTSNPASEALKGVTRNVTGALDAPRQYIQGSYREFAQNVQQQGVGQALLTAGEHSLEGVNPAALAQTDIAQSGIAATTGNVQQGSGFFIGPQSGVGQARQAEESQYGQITYPDGTVHNRSIGRDFASMFVEPGTRPFQVISGLTDAGVAIGADIPSQQLIAGAQAAKEFKAIGETTAVAEDTTRLQRAKDAAGILFNPGKRATYSPQVFDNWLGSSTGIKTVEQFANSDAASIFEYAPKMPAEIIGQLGKADTPEAVRDIMISHFGQGSELVPSTQLGRYGVIAKNSYTPEPIARMLQRFPANSWLNADNPSEVATQFNRMLDLFDTPADTKHELMNDLLSIDHKAGDRVTWNLRKKAVFNGFDEAVDRKASALAGKIDGLPDGFDPLKGNINQGTYATDIGINEPLTAEARQKVLDFRKKVNTLRDIMNPSSRNLVDHVHFDTEAATGRDLSFWDAQIDPGTGEIKLGNSPQPWLLNEFHGQMMPTPDWHEAQAQLSKFSALLDNPGYKIPEALITTAQDKVWKPLILTRPAGALRHIGSSQAAMYAEGLDSVFNHPLNVMSMILADSKLGSRLGFEQGVGNLATDALGGDLMDSDAFRRTLAKNTVFNSSEGASNLPLQTVMVPKGHALYDDTLAHEIGMLAHTKSDPLPRMIVDAMLNDKPLSTVQEQFWQMPEYRNDLQAIAPYRADGARLMDNRAATDAYVQRVATRISERTGNDPTLLNEFVHPTTSSKQELADLIGTVDHESLPPQAFGPQAPPGGTAKSILNKTLDYLWSKGFNDPLMASSARPAGKQAFWRSARELAPILDPADADRLIENATKAGLSNGDLRQLDYFARRPVENPISLETLNEVSTAKAGETLKKLFTNFVEKRQLVDAISVASPFAHVWAEELLRWSKFLAGDPTILHNLEYGFHEATDPAVADSTPVGSFMGVPHGRGFLYPDTNGQERFAYPLTAQAIKGLTGIPQTPLTGSLQGLSLGFDVIPGLGPVASKAADELIPKGPEWDGVRQLLFAQGDPTKSLFNLKEQMLPAWRRVFNMDDQRTQMATTEQAMTSLMSTGKYDIHNPDQTIRDAENNRLLADSRKAATYFTIIRGLTGLVAPSAPAPEWWLDDKTGTKIMFASLSKTFNDMYSKDPQHAVLQFMDQFGENAMLAIQGKTISTALGGGLPPTKEADRWARSNPGLAQNEPLSYGFFAPRNDTKLDFSVYDRQIAAGQRSQLTPEQFLQESNKRVAQAAYYAVRDQLPAVLSAQQAAVMAKFRTQLSQQYPGYADQYGNEIVGVPAQATVNQTITELHDKAIKDPALADNPAVEPLKAYMQIRDEIQRQSAASLANGNSWITSQQGANARQLLYQLGVGLATQYKEFQPIWESVLYREFQAGFEKDQGITSG